MHKSNHQVTGYSRSLCHRLLLSWALCFRACELKMDQPKWLNIDYSLKNIPVPSADSYKRRLIEKVESVIRRMRWKAFFFSKGSEEVEDEGQENNNYGFKTQSMPPASWRIETIRKWPSADGRRDQLQKYVWLLSGKDEGRHQGH